MSQNDGLSRERLVPRRRAAQKAAVTLADQLSDSDESDRASDVSEPSPSRKKGSRGIQYGGKRPRKSTSAVAVAGTRPKASPKSAVNSPQSTPRGRPPTKKRQLSPSLLSDTESTALSVRSSSIEFPDTLTGARSLVVRVATPVSRSGSSSPAKDRSARFPIYRQRTLSYPAARSLSLDRSTSTSAEKAISVDDDWDVTKLGALVWVRIDKHGNVINEYHDDDATVRYWWPARISEDDATTIPLRVTLFGRLPSLPEDTVQVDSPSSLNILSMLTSRGVLRFNSATFMCAQPPDSIQSSPRKKHKSDLETRWSDAVTKMVDEDAEDNDGLPTSLTSYTGRPSADSIPVINGHRRGKSKKGGRDDAEVAVYELNHHSELDWGRWSPPPCDPLVEVPGELVLARDGIQRKEYWPAKVMAYIPPSKPTMKPKYELLYLDSTRHQVTRNLFYTSDEPGFNECKLGEFESQVSIEEEEDDDDDDDMARSLEADELDLRDPNPPPSLPAPSREDFCELPISAQLAYVKPILSLIMKEEYEPVKKRHDAFMKGGAARISICKSATARGEFSAAEVAGLQNCLSRWILSQRWSMHEEVRGPSTETEALGQVIESNPSLQRVEIDLTASSPPPPPPSSLPFDEDMEVGGRSSSPPPIESPDEHNLAVRSMQQIGPSSPPTKPSEGSEDAVSVSFRIRGPSFETLSGVEKVEYCSNVLLPEAIVQLMLWRWEERTSLEPADTEEELRLHDLGVQKAEETDWVHDILRLREANLRQSKTFSAHASKSVGKVVGGGTRSRPKKVS